MSAIRRADFGVRAVTHSTSSCGKAHGCVDFGARGRPRN